VNEGNQDTQDLGEFVLELDVMELKTVMLRLPRRRIISGVAKNSV
jgi:hypothetical protein